MNVSYSGVFTRAISFILVVAFVVQPLSTFAAVQSNTVFESNLNYFPTSVSETLSGSSNPSDFVSQSGAFTYTIPIVTPGGRASLEPNLVINYSSQNSNNHTLFGYGWSHNIPYIERVNKSGVDRMLTFPL
ncbi:MAG: SpvB/TcaC N-terminal domain-containing protein [Methyloligellaceae bacterium]